MKKRYIDYSIQEVEKQTIIYNFRGKYIVKLYFRGGETILYQKGTKIVLDDKPKMIGVQMFDNFNDINEAKKFVTNIINNFNYFYSQMKY